MARYKLKNQPFKSSMLKRFFCIGCLFIMVVTGNTQNRLDEQFSAKDIHTISIHDDKLSSIKITTAKTDRIKLISILDGEYQNDFQLDQTKEKEILKLNLRRVSFGEISDDKRNAHKVIAATLQLQIPEHLNIDIKSALSSVELEGKFKSLYSSLSQGYFKFKGDSDTAIIHTIDGDIEIITNSGGMIKAKSNHGNVKLDTFFGSQSSWELKSINGDINVVKLR